MKERMEEEWKKNGSNWKQLKEKWKKNERRMKEE